jgi:RNA polymerase sigma-70 factor (ECF subfamily)
MIRNATKLKAVEYNSADAEKLLLNKISLGDEHAFRILFDQHRKRVYTYALKIVKSESYAEEILHDVFMKIWQHKSITKIESLELFLRTVTKNTTFNVLRRIKLEIKVNDEWGHDWQEVHNETEDSILLKDTKEILNQGINLLSPQQKLVYTLCRDEGLKYAEVAQRLSVSTETVKSHMKQALKFLRTYVSKHNDLSMLIIFFQIISERK